MMNYFLAQANGKGILCIVSELFDNNSMLGNITDSESTIKHISATAYAGGALRTISC